ncbi:MAG: MBOAT family protein [Planctomycetota bacterium]
MVFSSTVFLFLFLPLVLTLYYAVFLPAQYLENRFLKATSNIILLVASLFFYAWGEKFFLIIMLASILTNYLLGLWVDKERDKKSCHWIIALSVVVNLGLLAAYKYANFLVDNLNAILSIVGAEPVELAPVHLPIGISFFTFQAMSYVLDVYRRDGSVQKNPIDVALYISLFPQLIAGPIVRYRDVAAQLVSRVVSLDDFAFGVRRFVIGLGKKILIANTVAAVADKIFDVPLQHLTPGLAWLGILCYTVQIYFDFSGYSDMAIGLGRIFGFRFLENFQWPYIAQSIKEFWRRWHISLSSWFRDYLYIPLGGNKHSSFRTYFNLLIVFLLCGLWHGASWTFVIWGSYHGFFLVFERLGFHKWLDRCWRPLRHLYTLIVVIIGWVLFRAETLDQAGAMLSAMAGFAPGKGVVYHVGYYLDGELAWTLIVGCVFAIPWIPWFCAWREKRLSGSLSRSAGMADALLAFGSIVIIVLIFVACSMSLSAGTYNPFIYFRF